MSSKKRNSISLKIPAITLVVAALFFLAHRVLLSGITAPSYKDTPNRFLLFHSMKMIVLVGVNLVPLWLGYHGKLIRKVNLFSKLAKCWLIYVLVMISIFVFFFIVRGTLQIRDLWVILFPISQNMFAFGVGFILAFLAYPYVAMKLDHINDKRLLQISVLLTVLMVVLPSLFSKDIWNFNQGKSVLWQLYLVIIGYDLQRLKLIKTKNQIFGHLMLSIFLAIGAIFVMTYVSLLLHGNTSTANRFTLPFSFFGTYYSIALFTFLERIQEKIKLILPAKLMMIFLIVTSVITNSSLSNWSIGQYYRRPFADTGKQWLLDIIGYFLVYLIATAVLTFFLLIISHTKFFNRVASKISINGFDDLVKKAKTLWLWIVQRKRVFLVTVFFYCLIIIQMFAVTLVTSSTPVKTFIKNMLECQPQVVLNVGIMFVIFTFFFLLTNRFWYATLFTTIISILLTISSYLKISLRQEPVLPADMKMLTSISEIISMIQPTLLIISLIIIIFLAIGTWLLQRNALRKYHMKMSYKKRIIGLSVILVLFSGVFFINHRNSPSNLIFRLFQINNRFFNQPSGAQTNGPLVQFLVNIDVEVMKKPEGYSKEAINEIMKKYDLEAENINDSREEWHRDQTIIFNLSESFSDPMRVPETEVSQDPIPFIRSLMSQTTSGLMLSTGYGGGTANMEWESLTGLSLSNLSPTLTTPYSQLVETQAIAPNITNLFDNKVAIHPYTAKLYNRIHVFDKFGFDKFYYIGSENKLEYQTKISGSPYIDDESAYNETLRVINDSSGTQFIQLSTMQNHSPYTHDYPEKNYNFKGSSVTSSNADLLRTYMQGIHYTDEAVKKFIYELDKINKPITFVFYGDHLPGIYNGLNKSKYSLEMHETDFFVYNNKFSRENSKSDNSIVSPNYFSSLALAQAGIKVTPYYALLTKIIEELPPITTNPASSVNNKYNGGQVFITNDGKMLEKDQLSKKQQILLKDYQMIQYDLAVGNQYSAKWATQRLK